MKNAATSQLSAAKPSKNEISPVAGLILKTQHRKIGEEWKGYPESIEGKQIFTLKLKIRNFQMKINTT